MIRRYKPSLVVGFGSFHSFPILAAAVILRKPIILYESNIIMGKVNRFFHPFSLLAASQFPLHEKTCVVTPFHIAENNTETGKTKFTLLVFGGSQGARQINTAFADAALQLKEKGNVFHVIHLTGNEKERDKIALFYDTHHISHEVKAFEENMPLLYARADIAVCRAGAITISELIHFDLPSVLIPYPYSKDGHQEKNAAFLQNTVKGAVTVNNTNVLFEEIDALMQKKDRLMQMQSNIRKYKISNNRENFPLTIENIMEKLCLQKKTIIS